MPNQSLVDLTERTATADSDLIHVNSGGSDYKQTKANFLQGDLYHLFDNTSLLTTQIDALPSMGTFFGRIASYGAQSATGVPVNSNGDVFVQKFNGNYVVVDFHLIGNSDATYRKCKSGGTWESSWTQLPSRSEITSLNNSLTNSSISVTAGNSAVTITRNNSYKWGNIIVVAVRFQVTSALAIYDYVFQIPSTYRIVSDVYAPLMSSYFTTMADKGLYVDAGSYTIRASASIPSGNYTAYIPVLVRDA